MGAIRETSSGSTCVLGPVHPIGRAVSASLRIDRQYVSFQHAVLRWLNTRWELRDLGSRNGTFLNHSRVESSRDYPLAPGAVIAFGKDDSQWVFVDDAPPRVMAFVLGEGTTSYLESNVLELPSSDDPQATIYRSTDGWVLDRPNETLRPILNLQTVEIDGRTWRFCCLEGDSTLPLVVEREVRHLVLTFRVSSDEEHVQLLATCGGITLDMGARSHNYLLLTLARQRQADAQDGVPEPSRGWVYADELARLLAIDTARLNLEVHRLRKQFAAAGVLDAANVIERRLRQQQIRIGAAQVTIEPG